MPHTGSTRYALVSCHVERPLDDTCWALFSALQARRPGGFEVAALMRPPDERAGEDRDLWLERARVAAAHGPLGHHTHFVGPAHARPGTAAPEHAERVRAEAAWVRENGLEATLFCGGGWYIDEDVACAVADSGYADCTGTAFRPSYLRDGDPRLAANGPEWLTLPEGRRLLELPSTHSLGMASRAALRELPDYVHVYFHDTDLLSRRRRAALRSALVLLGRRSAPMTFDRLREGANALAERPFASTAT